PDIRRSSAKSCGRSSRQWSKARAARVAGYSAAGELRGTRLNRLVGAVLCAALVAGCAHRPIPQFPVDAKNAVELSETPFYAQDTHECGPAALAMVLDAAGVAVTPDQLVPQIYLPGRHGSLQVELIAASRRHERIPYVIDPRVDALFAEVAAGH